MIKTLLVGTLLTALEAVVTLPITIPLYYAFTTANNAYYLLAIPGTLAYIYFTGLAAIKELEKRGQ
jgi:hypothetical protein